MGSHVVQLSRTKRQGCSFLLNVVDVQLAGSQSCEFEAVSQGLLIVLHLHLAVLGHGRAAVWPPGRLLVGSLVGPPVLAGRYDAH